MTTTQWAITASTTSDRSLAGEPGTSIIFTQVRKQRRLVTPIPISKFSQAADADVLIGGHVVCTISARGRLEIPHHLANQHLINDHPGTQPSFIATTNGYIT
ncbi:MAG: hypothetical protein CL912_04805 [Deltaproteobacteria bacterium]|nr:hypothetical protein [Deltaproteobacteria bacterium]|tara:strand:- start:2332 stop:2637 length:306 start_codon:yes stop_codon:yes gene_type:complete